MKKRPGLAHFLKKEFHVGGGKITVYLNLFGLKDLPNQRAFR